VAKSKEIRAAFSRGGAASAEFVATTSITTASQPKKAWVNLKETEEWGILTSIEDRPPGHAFAVRPTTEGLLVLQIAFAKPLRAKSVYC